jgi:hypothetical protein
LYESKTSIERQFYHIVEMITLLLTLTPSDFIINVSRKFLPVFYGLGIVPELGPDSWGTNGLGANKSSTPIDQKYFQMI